MHPFGENYNPLKSSQHSFRKGLSTIAQLVEVVYDFSEVLNHKSQVNIIFLDLKKVFDKVNLSKLLVKLKSILKNYRLIRCSCMKEGNS